VQHRITDAAADTSSLERELQDLLSVEPSASFAAQVRARVQTVPPAAGWRLGWPAAAIGGMAVLAMAASVVMPRRTNVAHIGQDSVLASTAITLMVEIPSAPPMNGPSASSVTVPPNPIVDDRQRRVSRPSGRPPATAATGIVISRTESEALRRWLAAVGPRFVLASAFAPRPAVDAPLTDIEEIDIPELTIDPIGSVGP
jgi:hypothetical protein